MDKTMHPMKNIDFSKVMSLEAMVAYLPGQIVSRTLAQNDRVSMTLFSFAKDEEISTHASSGDAMVQVLEGKAQIIVDGTAFEVTKGETLVMPAEKPHSLRAVEPFKMLLTVVFP
jgi:quercetin dioxygenase-like cupin family protein